jgi:tetratricopeptide (TPR) repeat protein
MWLYWWLRGHVVLGRRKAEAALAAVESTDLPVGIRGRVRLAAATMSYACGDAVTAAAHWDAALAHAQAVADPELAAKAWAGTGLAALGEGDLRTAEQRFAASIASGPDPDGRTWVESLSRIWLGTCLLLRAEYAAARESVRAGMLMARERGDRLTIYVGLYNLAQAALADSNLAEARTHLHEGITLSEQTGDRSNLAYFLEALAVVEAAQRRPERAAALLGTSRSLRDSVGANVYGYYRPDVVLIAEAAERARTELGSAEYDAQVDRGRRMSLGEAVRLALSG